METMVSGLKFFGATTGGIEFVCVVGTVLGLAGGGGGGGGSANMDGGMGGGSGITASDCLLTCGLVVGVVG